MQWSSPEGSQRIQQDLAGESSDTESQEKYRAGGADRTDSSFLGKNRDKDSGSLCELWRCSAGLGSPTVRGSAQLGLSLIPI